MWQLERQVLFKGKLINNERYINGIFANLHNPTIGKNYFFNLLKSEKVRCFKQRELSLMRVQMK